MIVITSISNPRIKQIRALRYRPERERTLLFFAEGSRIVREAISAGAEIQSLIAAPDLFTSTPAHALVRDYRAAGGAVLEVTPSVFRHLSSRDGPQGLAAVVRQRWQRLPTGAGERECWVALAGVQHPGNLGAVLRCCDAAGATGVILVGSTADSYDPTAVRASMGTVFALPLVRASVEEFAGWIRRSS